MAARSMRATNPRAGMASNRLPLIIAIVALLIAAATYFYSGGFGANESHAAAETSEPAEVYRIGEFLLNVRTDGELRYLRAEIAATISGYAGGETDEGGHGGGSGDEELPCLEKPEEALARDAVVQILSDTEFSVLRTSEGRQRTKEQIKHHLDEAIEQADVEDVLFLSFVMQ